MKVTKKDTNISTSNDRQELLKIISAHYQDTADFVKQWFNCEVDGLKSEESCEIWEILQKHFKTETWDYGEAVDMMISSDDKEWFLKFEFGGEYEPNIEILGEAEAFFDDCMAIGFCKYFLEYHTE